MADQRVYTHITPEIFLCMKKDSQKEHKTKYDYNKDNPNSGTATTVGGWGPTKYTVKLAFIHDLDKGILTYTEIEISGAARLAKSKVWSGIEDAIKSCSKDAKAK